MDFHVRFDRQNFWQLAGQPNLHLRDDYFCASVHIELETLL